MTATKYNFWHYLPDDVLHIVLDYADIVVYRYGKYMDRIPKDDRRYAIIESSYVSRFFTRYQTRVMNTFLLGDYVLAHIYDGTRHHVKFQKYSHQGLPENSTYYVLTLENTYRSVIPYMEP